LHHRKIEEKSSYATHFVEKSQEKKDMDIDISSNNTTENKLFIRG
jgi:hypothetical protein